VALASQSPLIWAYHLESVPSLFVLEDFPPFVIISLLNRTCLANHSPRRPEPDLFFSDRAMITHSALSSNQARESLERSQTPTQMLADPIGMQYRYLPLFPQVSQLTISADHGPDPFKKPPAQPTTNRTIVQCQCYQPSSSQSPIPQAAVIMISNNAQYPSRHPGFTVDPGRTETLDGLAEYSNPPLPPLTEAEKKFINEIKAPKKDDPKDPWWTSVVISAL
jgi:hypothetical protein